MNIFKVYLIFSILFFQSVFAISSEEVMKKSQNWFKSAKAWSLDFKLQLFYAESPDVVIQQGHLTVAEGDKFKLELGGINFYSDGESLWQHNVEQKQVLIKAVEDLSSSLHPSELLFKYLNCKALDLKEGVFAGKKMWILKLDPSKYKDQFSEMEVWLNQKDFSPERLFTIDLAKNSSWYNIVNLKVIKAISVEDFKYKSIPDVDEIDMR